MMYKKLPTSHKTLVFILLFFSCQTVNLTSIFANTSTPLLIEEEATVYELRPFVQILEDGKTSYTIKEIISPTVQTQFQSYPKHTLDITNYQYYWGKIQLENRLANAEKHQEWVLFFSNSWTTMDIFTQATDGSWEQERNGTFTPDKFKNFAPTATGNLVKVLLPPQQTVTIYFRGKSERMAIVPNFRIRLRDIETHYNDLLQYRANNSLFMGFVLMMFLYNLIVYFFGRDRSFIFYSVYLLMIIVYSAFMSEDLADWLEPILFPNHPEYLFFGKLSIYIAMMCYFAFIRSFLDLEQLLPKWDKFFNIVIYLGFPLMVLDVVLLLWSNYSYVIDDKVTVPYILTVVVGGFLFLYPLAKTRDKKGYFIIAGISALGIGALMTVVARLVTPAFSLFYLKIGTIVEIIVFSLGLAYRQRQQKQAKQQADFELKKTQLLQEKKQLEAERLKELNEFKARFYTNITHEFRTPLTVIMGMTENIKKHKQEKQLIQRNSQNLLRLINQLLDLSKLESGTLTLNKVHKDIIIYLQYLTESFYSTATKKNIRLLFYPEVATLMMDYDEEKIQHIVYNLLSNALKFTPQYGKIIFHASQIMQKEQAFLKLKIKDSGIGISAENLAHIFDRFYQVDGSITKKEEGTGIGLALTKELVKLMNGRIEVVSEIDKGTEFILYLPIETQISATVSEPIDSETFFKQDHLQNDHEILFTNKKQISSFSDVLIIEDNQDVIVYIKTLLKNNYNIQTAKNGALGIEKALETIPDIIISDVMMPEKNGYEVCEILKKDERTSHIPIILLTAKATQNDKIHGLKYGADAYLTKPFDKEELLIRLEKLVEVRRELQQKFANSSKDVTGFENLSQPARMGLTMTQEDIFLQKLHKHIETHLSDAQFGIPQLATAVQLSRTQLYRKLKALTGKTPVQFIRSYRLQKSLELLQKRELNISEIAYDVGFTDPSYFSRVFQKEFGRSPSDFLK